MLGEADLSDTLTFLVELLVGLGCIAAAAAAVRVRRLRWLSPILAIAGVAASAHAVVSFS